MFQLVLLSHQRSTLRTVCSPLFHHSRPLSHSTNLHASSLPTDYYCQQDNMDFKNTASTSLNNNAVPLNEPKPEVPDPTPVKFPRIRTLSTKGRKSIAPDRTDENSFLLNPPKTPLGIARTVRRTLSGGLSNILRPFQPSMAKVRARKCTLCFVFTALL